jgi:histidine triad (HIT) family protein
VRPVAGALWIALALLAVRPLRAKALAGVRGSAAETASLNCVTRLSAAEGRASSERQRRRLTASAASHPPASVSERLTRGEAALVGTLPAFNASMQCTFCDLIHGSAEVSICHEDSDAIAFMDIQPVNNGHVLVVPREHYESLLDVPQELGLHLFRVTMRLTAAIRQVTGCEDFNIVVNSGTAAGQDEPHYHVHIIPRRDGDGFDIPLPFNGSEMPDRTVLDAHAARIISALRDPMKLEGAMSAKSARRPSPVMTRTETPVALRVFNESSPMKRSVSADDTGDGRAAAWQVHEGAHGELLHEPDADAGT